jgi:hypothetical protein
MLEHDGIKLAVLIRGHNYLEADRFGYRLDARTNCTNLIENVLLPVRRLYPSARFVFATYDSPILEDVAQRLMPTDALVLPKEGSHQITTYMEGLRYIEEHVECDAVVVIRFDTAFKHNFDNWDMLVNRTAVFFPFREYLTGWRDHRRVGDAVHVIGRDALPHFITALGMVHMAGRSDLHMLYYYLRTLHWDLQFLFDGYWDSNTLFGNRECDNPFYTYCNRPKIEDYPEYYGYLTIEIHAE